ncbi:MULTISPECIES: hypothetical protein [unclassified Gordonia (in: high G+C Gram-positive bacteria)]|uniref:hypothetical protein n=1 Tax=unclassified Gordonia (in: high G+C Gram-positive bacteria) TaxID=2657482 RepID=UPI00071C3987|nr:MULTISPECIES: hypothetical protein [unclassified Gordonia (in: high G+C Gram-positive bacteria)]SCB75224.1 Predicted glycosyl transferase [Gordonia sp. v-85]
MIGYYVHHQGRGHCSRATAVAGHLGTDVVALTSASLTAPVFSEVITLERDDSDPQPRDVDAGGLLHWAPRHDGGLRTRMAQLAEFVETRRPAAVVVDVSVEVTLFLRLMGVPVIVTAQPGVRDDLPHQLAYRAAHAIIAPWPAELYQPDWLREHLPKTVFTGGISRFDGRLPVSHPTFAADILVVTGAGGVPGAPHPATTLGEELPEHTVVGLGPAFGTWVDDPWPFLCSARVTVIGAGQGSVADAAAAGRPAVVIPEDRPFAEQRATGNTLARSELALVTSSWPSTERWRLILDTAGSSSPEWSRWHTAGAAERAARAIEAVAHR